jgi:hypothetical protein
MQPSETLCKTEFDYHHKYECEICLQKILHWAPNSATVHPNINKELVQCIINPNHQQDASPVLRIYMHAGSDQEQLMVSRFSYQGETRLGNYIVMFGYLIK